MKWAETAETGYRFFACGEAGSSLHENHEPNGESSDREEALAHLAHDLSNLLMPLAVYPRLIESRLRKGHPAARLCRAMEEASMEAARMVETLCELGTTGHSSTQSASHGRSPEPSSLPLPFSPVAVSKHTLGVRGNGETVLVVDDTPLQQKVLKSMLEILGYGVTSVGSGEEALAYLERNRADLIVVDMAMPAGIDGLETYRRALDLRPDQPGILLSGMCDSALEVKAYKAGVGRFIVKPVTVERMATAVREVLDGLASR